MPLNPPTPISNNGTLLDFLKNITSIYPPLVSYLIFKSNTFPGFVLSRLICNCNYLEIRGEPPQRNIPDHKELHRLRVLRHCFRKTWNPDDNYERGVHRVNSKIASVKHTHLLLWTALGFFYQQQMQGIETKQWWWKLKFHYYYTHAERGRWMTTKGTRRRVNEARGDWKWQKIQRVVCPETTKIHSHKGCHPTQQQQQSLILYVDHITVKGGWQADMAQYRYSKQTKQEMNISSTYLTHVCFLIKWKSIFKLSSRVNKCISIVSVELFKPRDIELKSVCAGD